MCEGQYLRSAALPCNPEFRWEGLRRWSLRVAATRLNGLSRHDRSSRGPAHGMRSISVRIVHPMMPDDTIRGVSNYSFFPAPDPCARQGRGSVGGAGQRALPGCGGMGGLWRRKRLFRPHGLSPPRGRDPALYAGEFEGAKMPDFHRPPREPPGSHGGYLESVLRERLAHEACYSCLSAFSLRRRARPCDEVESKPNSNEGNPS